MATGEFHVYDPNFGIWHPLPPHPGFSRWAPSSFVLQGTSKAYFIGGYDRSQQILFDDLWMIDLEPVLLAMSNNSNGTSSSTTFNGTEEDTSNDHATTLPGSSGVSKYADSDSYTSASAKVMTMLLCWVYVSDIIFSLTS
jgi:hypothetical protein